MPEFLWYQRTGFRRARPFVPGEDLTGVSVSDNETPEPGGMVVYNPQNPDDQWYVAPGYFQANFVLVDAKKRASNLP